MRELIPRQMFDVAIQAAIGANIIARETIKALRKNVLAKCYGGDITRKKQAARKAEGRQEAHEADRLRRDSAGGVPGHPPGGRHDECSTAVLRGLAAIRRLVLRHVDGNFALLLFLDVVTCLLAGRALRLRCRAAPPTPRSRMRRAAQSSPAGHHAGRRRRAQRPAALLRSRGGSTGPRASSR